MMHFTYGKRMGMVESCGQSDSLQTDRAGNDIHIEGGRPCLP